MKFAGGIFLESASDVKDGMVALRIENTILWDYPFRS